MKTAAWAITILSWVALCRAIVPQTLPDPGRMVHIPGNRVEDLIPVDVTVCDLARAPEGYRGRMVKVRGAYPDRV
jgi:hypothetical protein